MLQWHPGFDLWWGFQSRLKSSRRCSFSHFLKGLKQLVNDVVNQKMNCHGIYCYTIFYTKWDIIPCCANSCLARCQWTTTLKISLLITTTSTAKNFPKKVTGVDNLLFVFCSCHSFNMKKLHDQTCLKSVRRTDLGHSLIFIYSHFFSSYGQMPHWRPLDIFYVYGKTPRLLTHNNPILKATADAKWCRRRKRQGSFEQKPFNHAEAKRKLDAVWGNLTLFVL